MGLFWELFQELQINKHKTESGTLEDRVAELEDGLMRTQDVLARALDQLEQITGEAFPVDEAA